MLSIAYYLLKVIVCSGILYGYYWLLLRNKVFHKYNRFYLMAAVVLALLLPLIKISFWQQSTATQSSVLKMLQAVSHGDEYMDTVVISSASNDYDLTQLYPFAYLLVSLVMLAVFMHTLLVIAGLLKKYPRQTIDSISFINTDARSTPFSFLNYIFWNHNIDMETTTGNQIFKHELAHVQEGHTYDKLFINLVLIVFWCNPFFWLYRRELNMIHEFIADKKAVEDSDTAAFAAMILQATYPQHRFQLTNNFFYSPVKRRLLMLTKNKNPKVNYLGRIMALPLLVLIFAAFTFKMKSGMEAGASTYNGKKIVVVIDAGHGGNDKGAKFESYGNGIKNPAVYEKDIVLDIAKKIQQLNTNSNIEIVLTRDEDVFMDVWQKADFANKHHADMLISIHLDAAAKDQMNTQTGLSVWVAKDNAAYKQSSTLLAASLIEAFSKNYALPVAGNPMQRVSSIRVLDGVSCPAVLIEPGYITNYKDVKFLQTAEGKTTVANNILTAIANFAAANSVANLPATVEQTIGTGSSVYESTASIDSGYLASEDYRNKALVIIDQKEMGNVGMNYVQKNNIKFSTIVTYSSPEASIRFGNKGRYGVIQLTSNNAICITADTLLFNDKTDALKSTGTATGISSSLSNSRIFIDGKISSVSDLKAIAPARISTVNIVKEDDLGGIANMNGKTAVINVTLKPETWTEVKVDNNTPKTLYIVNNLQANSLNNIQPADIQQVNVLKDEAAVARYGNKAKNGVVEITLKQATAPLQEVVVESRPRDPLYVINNIIVSAAKFKALNTNVIESINVLKDSSATVKYGDKGKNGVIEIFTKKNMVINLSEPKLVTGVQIVPDNDKIFTAVEVPAYFAAGNDAWKTYLQTHLNPSIPAAEGWKPGNYTVIVEFIIHTDGTVSDVTTTNYKGSKTAQHCIDLVKQSGKWVPAMQNGHNVNAYRKQPITFVITKEDVQKPITTIYYWPSTIKPLQSTNNSLTSPH